MYQKVADADFRQAIFEHKILTMEPHCVQNVVICCLDGIKEMAPYAPDAQVSHSVCNNACRTFTLFVNCVFVLISLQDVVSIVSKNNSKF